jgi:lipooligosaccharide transport system permease protein
MASAGYPRTGLPASVRAGRGRTVAMVERNLMIYRHTWLILLAEIIEPLLYLVSFGVGVGTLIGHISLADGVFVSYPEFVAPALLATAAMNGAMNETTFNMFSKLKTDRTYESILTTSMTVRSVALGEVSWALLRGTLVSAAYLAVVSAAGLVRSPWALLVVPGALAIGFAFASVGLLVVTWLRTWQDFQLIQLVMLPMFLFATTFYPLDVYPQPIQRAVVLLPLYQSIQLVRGPFLGSVGIGLLGNLAYLIAFGAAALVLAIRRLNTTLRP